MKQIKFRYWNGKKMLGQEAFINHLNKYIARNDEHLMQYTGLEDKNGNDVFEGDLFITEIYCKEDYYEDGVFNSKEYYEENPIEEIIFYNSSWMYREVTNSNSILLLSDKIEEVEIIGNIHQNKELLGA